MAIGVFAKLRMRNRNHRSFYQRMPHPLRAKVKRDRQYSIQWSQAYHRSRPSRKIPDDSYSTDGSIKLNDSIASTSLDTYFSIQELTRLPYAKF